MNPENHSTDTRSLLEKFGESQNLVFFGVFIILIPLMMHTANLLLSVSIIKNEYYAYFFAVGFDLAIFIFAAHGRMVSAGGIAFVVFLLNVSFLNLETLNLKFDPLWVKFMVTLVLSISSAWILHSYVVLFNDKKSSRDELKDLKYLKYNQEEEIGKLKATIIQLQGKVKEGEELAKEAEIFKRSLELEKLREQEREKMSISQNSEKDEDSILFIGNSVLCKHCQISFDSKEKYETFSSKHCHQTNCKTNPLPNIKPESVT